MGKKPVPGPFEYSNPYPSPSQARWHELYRIAPQLRVMHKDFWADKPPPPLMLDKFFLQLMACYADPVRREILRSLNLDLSSDDVLALIAMANEEGRA